MTEGFIVNNTQSISFFVNGSKVSSDEIPTTPLLYILRNDLKLKGTRFGCGEGSCGACTVLVDGVATLSCNTPLEAIAGKSVRTIESVLADDTNPVLQRIMETHAWQCGYCTAGIIMKAVAVLGDERTGERSTIVASRHDLAKELDSNLCRCGAHPRVLDALEPLLKSGDSNNAD